jgi:hypothetical protein
MDKEAEKIADQLRSALEWAGNNALTTATTPDGLISSGRTPSNQDSHPG